MTIRLTLEQQILEALAHPVGDDSLVTDDLALMVLGYVKSGVDSHLTTIIERDEARAELQRLQESPHMSLPLKCETISDVLRLGHTYGDNVDIYYSRAALKQALIELVRATEARLVEPPKPFVSPPLSTQELKILAEIESAEREQDYVQAGGSTVPDDLLADAHDRVDQIFSEDDSDSST